MKDTKYPNWRRASTPERRPPGRPYLGNKKVTFKLSPAIVAALTKASSQLGLNKSELTEKALSNYLEVLQ